MNYFGIHKQYIHDRWTALVALTILDLTYIQEGANLISKFVEECCGGY